MNRIDEVFAALKSEGRTALIPFVTMGDPELSVSLDIIGELEAAGADIIELGVPYSDPLADGPVIQRASARALQNGVTLVDCIRAAGAARARGVKLPFVLFSYYNPVLQLGLERFFDLVEENGISGIIIPDLPYEENGEVREMSVRRNIHLIPLVAPTSQQRVRQIVSGAAGFVYCVSSLGVTGMRSQFFEGIEAFLQMVRESTSVPIAVGFGISTNEHFRSFSRLCDGVIVGSAIVRQIEEALPLLTDPAARGEGLKQIRRFVQALKGE